MCGNLDRAQRDPVSLDDIRETAYHPRKDASGVGGLL
jgi:hypothetical protein